jgi:hypothetical protein
MPILGPTISMVLADKQPTAEDVMPAVWAGIGILAFAVICFVVFKWMKKRMSQAEAGPVTGFTLGDLRQLVKEGKMSQDEYDRPKTNIVEAHKKAMAVKPARDTISNKQAPPSV